MRSIPVHLLGILVVAAAFAVIGGGSSVLLLLGAMALVLGALVVQAQAAPKTGTRALSPGVPPVPKPIDEVEHERVLRVSVYAATLLVAGVAVGLAAASFAAALVLLLLASGWVIMWWPPSMRRYSLSTTTDIRCDSPTAFAFFSDQRNTPRYYYMFDESVDKVGDAPIGPGTEFRAHIVFRAGQTPSTKEDTSFDSVQRIVEFEPNHRLAITVISGLAPNTGTYTLEPITGGTRVTYRYDHVLSFPSCLLGSRLFGVRADRFMKATRLAAWARAKEILETGTT